LDPQVARSVIVHPPPALQHDPVTQGLETQVVPKPWKALPAAHALPLPEMSVHAKEVVLQQAPNAVQALAVQEVPDPSQPLPAAQVLACESVQTPEDVQQAPTAQVPAPQVVR
jgi:hypothetical protein